MQGPGIISRFEDEDPTSFWATNMWILRSLIKLSVLFFIVFVGWVVNRYVRMVLQRRALGLSGPPILPVLGSMMEFARITAANNDLVLRVHEEFKRLYGKTYSYFIGPRQYVVFENLDDAQEILIKQFANFTDREPMDFIHSSLNSALVAQKGHAWRGQRNRISPAFTTAKLRKMELAIQDKVDLLVSNIGECADSAKEWDAFRAFKCLTLDVIADVAFAIPSSCQDDPNDAFLFHASTFFANMPDPRSNPLMAVSLLFPEIAKEAHWLHETIGKHDSERWLVQRVREAVRTRLANPTDRTDLISLLLPEDSIVDDDVEDTVVANCFAFLLAGYETTSTALAFTTWLLAKHEDVQQTLYEEIEDLDLEDAETRYDVLMKAPYLNAVFKEALRLFPPITFFVNRTCVTETNIGGVPMKPGTVACVPVWNIHRDERVWAEADSFLPERFLSSTPHHPLAWIPFGGGPRKCVGSRFAELEIKAALVQVVRHFRLRTAPGNEEMELRNPTVLLAPKEVRTLVERREDANANTVIVQ